MFAVNQGGHFLLTKTVTKNRLAKLINKGGRLKISASVNKY